MLMHWLRWVALGTTYRSRGRTKARRRRVPNRYRFRFESLETRLAPADFLGGVNVAGGDVDGDGLAEVVTGAMAGGGPHVKVFSGATGQLLSEFMAYDLGFQGGVNVAVGRVTGAAGAEVITGAGAGGGPHVKVFNGTSGELVRSFMAFDEGFGGGVHVAAGDVNGDGIADIIAAAGPGGGSQVNVYDGASNTLLNSFQAYDAGWRGGSTVATSDVNGDGRAEIITGAGPGGGSHVKVFDALTGSLISEFNAYDAGFRGGVRVGGSVGGGSEVLTAAGPGGGPHVKVFQGPTAVNEFMAYDPGFKGGVSVSGLGVNDSGSPALVTGAGAGGPSQVGVFASNGQTPTVTFTALDPAQTPSSGFSATVSNDRVKPTVTITSPPSGQVGSNNITVQGVAADDKSGLRTIDAQVDGGAFTAVSFDANGNFSFTTSLALDGTATGPHTVTIRARDKGGNSATASVSFTLDQAPVVSSPIANVTVAQNAPPTVIDLKQSFSDPDKPSDGTENTVVRLNTNFGPIDIELFDEDTPGTVANFLAYVNSGRYTDTVFHRSVQDSIFVIQGGGFVFPDLDEVITDPPIQNEPGIPNTRGTISMAKTQDPDSATSQFFINVEDNPALDSPSNSGGFTVFGQLTDASLDVMDEIAAVPISDQGGTFAEIPLVNYSGIDFPTDATRDNFVIVDNAAVQGSGGGGGSSGLTFSIVSNTNSTLVSTQISDGNLTLTYTAGQTGTAVITVQATDEFGLFVQSTFTVTVG